MHLLLHNLELKICVLLNEIVNAKHSMIMIIELIRDKFRFLTNLKLPSSCKISAILHIPTHTHLFASDMNNIILTSVSSIRNNITILVKIKVLNEYKKYVIACMKELYI